MLSYHDITDSVETRGLVSLETDDGERILHSFNYVHTITIVDSVRADVPGYSFDCVGTMIEDNLYADTDVRTCTRIPIY